MLEKALCGNGSTNFVLDFSLEDEPHSGRPKAISDEDFRGISEADPSQTVREIAEELGLGKSTVANGLECFGKVKKLDNWVPHRRSDRQDSARLEVPSALLLRSRNDLFLGRIVTCDEKWVMYDNRRRSGQWMDFDEPPR